MTIGGQGSCIFNSCIEKGISAGVICMHAALGEIPSSSQQLKLQEPCPLLYLVMCDLLTPPHIKSVVIFETEAFNVCSYIHIFIVFVLLKPTIKIDFKKS